MGGNANTCLIANISPDVSFLAESISTLRFAARAKCVKTHARVNLDVQGDVSGLRAEIATLRAELAALKETKVLEEEASTSVYQLRHLLKECLLEKHETYQSELAVRDVLNKQSLLLEQKEKALQSKDMVLKFRDATIDRVTKGAAMAEALQEQKVPLRL